MRYVWIASQKWTGALSWHWQIIGVFDNEAAARDEAVHYSERLGVETMVHRHIVEGMAA